MKIKKAVNVYSITIPGTNNPSSFFEASTHRKLYFSSHEEAQLYKQLHYPNYAVMREKIVAILDKNKSGDDRWVALNMIEDMRDSNNNKSNRGSYYDHSLEYMASPQLEKVIKANPNSVFVVREVNRSNWETDSGVGYGGPSGSKCTYDCSDTVDESTRFLYVDDNDRRWFVERGSEINMTPASDLVLQQKLQQNKEEIARLLTVQDTLEQELHHYPPNRYN